MLAKLLERTDRERFSPIVVSMLSENTVVAPRIEAAGIPVHKLGLHRGIPNPVGVTRLATIIRKFRPDILQSWMYHADLLGLVAGRMTRVPSLIWNIRSSDLGLQDVHRSLRVVIKAHAALARFADTVVVNSASGLRYHESLGHHPRSWKLIQNGFDLERFVASPTRRAEGRARLGVAADTTVIGMVARLDPQKDHQTFINAAQILRRTHPAAVFVLAGTGLTPGNETLVEQLKRANVWQNTRLLGPVADTSSLFPSLDINTLSSAYGEGFPNALGEAMSCEVPCVATDVGDSALLLADTGRIVAPRSPDAVAAGWRDLIEMGSAQRHALGAAARARIQAQFSLDGIVSQYEALYTDIAARARNGNGFRD
jgi:glycosyltransferase involved in cell wall biosynthesis